MGPASPGLLQQALVRALARASYAGTGLSPHRPLAAARAAAPTKAGATGRYHAAAAAADPSGSGTHNQKATHGHGVSEPADGSGGPGADGPILADFLAMGADRPSVPPELAPVGAAETAASAKGAEASAGSARIEGLARNEGDDEVLHAADAVRERRLIEASLQPPEAISQVLSETPSREPLRGAAPTRAPGGLPRFFAEGYAGYIRSSAGAEGGGRFGTEMSAEQRSAQGARARRGAGSLRAIRLRVLPEHRAELQKMLCKAVLFNFLQEQREVWRLPASERPLLLPEARRVREHLERGEPVRLVKYLAETEHHIVSGENRQSRVPGSPVWRGVKPLDPEQEFQLRAERRKLVEQWDLSRRDLREDALVRVFLDGRLSWPRVRDLLSQAPPVEKRTARP